MNYFIEFKGKRFEDFPSFPLKVLATNPRILKHKLVNRLINITCASDSLPSTKSGEKECMWVGVKYKQYKDNFKLIDP